LDGGTTRYLASGSIDGTIRDRWSLDEYDGHLRVAVSWPDRAGSTRENGVVVLDEHDGRLEQVGELRGLGRDEEIQSVRWFDDLAVLVTFRQMDPLYTIDLADPTHPRKLGELKIPGFSSYLHPIGGDRLLGLGTDATVKGRSLGAQAGVFDIGDSTHPRQLGKVTFGEESRLGASDDPHAFTWLPGSNAAITSLESWSSEDSRLVLLRVSTSGAVTTERLPSPGGWQPRALPLDGGRVALVGSHVRIVDLEG
ncbi:MAG: beta-propeller domain-containing protein, partial [Marmoricola sp.]